MKRFSNWRLVGVAAVLTVLSGPTVHAQSVTFLSSTNSSNYSDSGLNLGNLGYWFANFNASAPVTGAAIDSNAASALPAWVTINPAPDTTFPNTASTSGGQANWATLTLPNGMSGLSGAVVDSASANNSNNSVRMLELGPGVPSSFILSIVTDNTAGQHDPASRLRARAEQAAVFDVSAVNTPPGLGANMNGSPDVYRWRYDGMNADAFIKVQLNSGAAGEAASIAGFMFDVVPEPGSGLLLAVAGAALAGCAAAVVYRN